MRRTEILQEVRKMRFQEVYETWQEKHWKSIGKVGKELEKNVKAIGKGDLEKGTGLGKGDRFIFCSTFHSLSRASLVF